MLVGIAIISGCDKANRPALVATEYDEVIVKPSLSPHMKLRLLDPPLSSAVRC